MRKLNIFFGILCGFAGGLNLVVGNILVGVFCCLVSFINFAIAEYLKEVM